MVHFLIGVDGVEMGHRQAGRFLDGFNIRAIERSTEQECMDHCLQDEECKSIDFQTDINKCYLNSANEAEEPGAMQENNISYVYRGKIIV